MIYVNASPSLNCNTLFLLVCSVCNGYAQSSKSSSSVTASATVQGVDSNGGEPFFQIPSIFPTVRPSSVDSSSLFLNTMSSSSSSSSSSLSSAITPTSIANDHHALSQSAVGGIAGVCTMLLIIALVVFLCLHRRQREKRGAKPTDGPTRRLSPFDHDDLENKPNQTPHESTASIQESRSDSTPLAPKELGRTPTDSPLSKEITLSYDPTQGVDRLTTAMISGGSVQVFSPNYGESDAIFQGSVSVREAYLQGQNDAMRTMMLRNQAGGESSVPSGEADQISPPSYHSDESG